MYIYIYKYSHSHSHSYSYSYIWLNDVKHTILVGRWNSTSVVYVLGSIGSDLMVDVIVPLHSHVILVSKTPEESNSFLQLKMLKVL